MKWHWHWNAARSQPEEDEHNPIQLYICMETPPPSSYRLAMCFDLQHRLTSSGGKRNTVFVAPIAPGTLRRVPHLTLHIGADKLPVGVLHLSLDRSVSSRDRRRFHLRQHSSSPHETKTKQKQARASVGLKEKPARITAACHRPACSLLACHWGLRCVPPRPSSLWPLSVFLNVEAEGVF